jgi:Spy/CpxP family protein refolding chaperone
MKCRTLALSAVLLATQLAFADPPAPPPRGGPPIDRIARDLGLDEGQKAEVKRIFEEMRAKREAQREQLKASGQEPTRELMQQYRQQQQSDLLQQLSGVLTAEQLQKFKQIQAARREHMHGGAPPPAPAAAQ